MTRSWWGEATDEPALASQGDETTAHEDARPTLLRSRLAAARKDLLRNKIVEQNPL